MLKWAVGESGRGELATAGDKADKEEAEEDLGLRGVIGKREEEEEEGLGLCLSAVAMRVRS